MMKLDIIYLAKRLERIERMVYNISKIALEKGNTYPQAYQELNKDFVKLEKWINKKRLL